jgi:hypothetical protein
MNHNEIVSGLLTPLWLGVPVEYKAKYSYSIWEQFEDNIRSAAYTSRLSEFLSNITRRLGITVPANHIRSVNEIVLSGGDKRVLKLLRSDATVLVLMTRVANDERREELRAKKEKKAGTKKR